MVDLPIGDEELALVLKDSYNDVPHIVAGSASGKLQGGRHLAYPSKTVPTGNLLVSILDLFGVREDAIGDSTGRLPGLT